jgi:polysaccharide export outer membrane protein
MRRLFSALLAVALLAGCAPEPPRSRAFAAFDNAPYTLAAGDRLRVIVFGQDSLSNSYAVDGSGHISMPLIGLVPAHGATTAALERAIEAKLRAGFLREPRVAVEVEAYRPFFMLGEVQAAGQYPFINGMTVQNAIAVAGGFSPRAQQSGAVITRIVNGRPITASVPMTQQVRPGDTITVRERFF